MVDNNFKYWISMQIKGDDWSRKLVRHINYLFENTYDNNIEKYVSKSTFDNEEELLRRVKLIIYRVPDAIIFANTKKESEKILIKNIQKYEKPEHRSFITMLHYVKSVMWYCKFLGKQYKKIETFYSSMVNINGLMEKSKLIVNVIFDKPVLYLYNTYINQLRIVQKYIDSRIEQFLMFRNLSENKSSLKNFGLDVMIPFIELLIRLEELPFEIKSIQKMKYIDHHIENDVYSLFETSLLNSLDVTECELYQSIYLTPSHGYRKNMCISYDIMFTVEENTNERNGIEKFKLSKHTLKSITSFYIYFYIKYCKYHQTSSRKNEKLVFVGEHTGEIKNLSRRVYQFSQFLDLNNDYLIPVDHINQYVYKSKLLWLAARNNEYNTEENLDVTRLTNDFELLGLGIAKVHEKYNTFAQYLRNLKIGLQILNGMFDITENKHKLLRSSIAPVKHDICEVLTLEYLNDIGLDVHITQIGQIEDTVKFKNRTKFKNLLYSGTLESPYVSNFIIDELLQNDKGSVKKYNKRFVKNEFDITAYHIKTNIDKCIKKTPPNFQNVIKKIQQYKNGAFNEEGVNERNDSYITLKNALLNFDLDIEEHNIIISDIDRLLEINQQIKKFINIDNSGKHSLSKLISNTIIHVNNYITDRINNCTKMKKGSVWKITSINARLKKLNEVKKEVLHDSNTNVNKTKTIQHIDLLYNLFNLSKHFTVKNTNEFVKLINESLKTFTIFILKIPIHNLELQELIKNKINLDRNVMNTSVKIEMWKSIRNDLKKDVEADVIFKYIIVIEKVLLKILLENNLNFIP